MEYYLQNQLALSKYLGRFSLGFVEAIVIVLYFQGLCFPGSFIFSRISSQSPAWHLPYASQDLGDWAEVEETWHIGSIRLDNFRLCVLVFHLKVFI